MFKDLHTIHGKGYHPKNGTFVYQDTEFECEFIPESYVDFYMRQIVDFIIKSYEERNLPVVKNILPFITYNENRTFINNTAMLAYIKTNHSKYYDDLAKWILIQ